MVALGILNLVTDIMNNSIDIKGIIVITVLSLFGFGSIMRSLSEKMAKKDRREELDKRNRFITLKSKSQSFQFTQSISFLLMLTLLVMEKISGYENFIAIGVGLAFSLTISMFAEIFTYMYYESKN